MPIIGSIFEDGLVQHGEALKAFNPDDGRWDDPVIVKFSDDLNLGNLMGTLQSTMLGAIVIDTPDGVSGLMRKNCVIVGSTKSSKIVAVSTPQR